ncbi:hypothetical protein LK12_06265 [Novosphingobium malaysiense]|uniref:EF-hand domain-containing protein n=2 Tax=Novosphingobium malaysiense TaxID=1348853 RepID=A0A0B1ZTD8_9SPHN|nr:hypothetical protein LK12_06265 [Novosphingobium malaysiense]
MTKLTLGLSVAALSIGGIAYAQPGRGGGPMMDMDGNGTVTRAEAKQASDAMFTRMDVNNDGKLDQADRQARHEARRAEMFAMLDTDNDGSISRDEFMAMSPHGRGMGGPGMDGPQGPGMRGADGDGKGWHGKRHHGHHGRHGGMMRMAKMADTNNDGAVSKAEFDAAAEKHFAMVDTDNDGTITQAERQAAHAKMKAQWQARKADSNK